ncbi:MAG: cyclic nucleotide-binding domain-containing protein [Desulfamplus sp.]|nr:cyclic nucleotide-binding domain-containing protein [Desulfamplus sp.]
MAFLKSHTYFTKSARSLRDRGKKNNINKLKKMIFSIRNSLKLSSEAKKSHVVLDDMFAYMRTTFVEDADEYRDAFVRIIDRFEEHFKSLIRISGITDPDDLSILEERAVFLKTHPLFRDCSSYDLLNMALYIDEIEIKPDTDIIIQSMAVDDVFFIKNGEVDILVDGEFVVRRGCGSSVGEMSCLRNEPFANATVRTASMCQLLKIPRVQFMNIVDLLPNIWKMLHKDMIYRLDDMASRFSELLRHTTQGLVKVNPQGKITSEISLIGMQYLGLSELNDICFGTHLFSNSIEAQERWDKFFPELFARPSEFETVSKNLPSNTDFIHPESGERKYFFYYYPCFDYQSNLVAVDVCIEDRTVQILAALEIQKAREEAERNNILLTEQMHEIQDKTEKLRQKDLQLLMMDRIAGIGTLSAGVSHEINTPLGVIKSGVSALKKDLNKLSEALEFWSRQPESDFNPQEYQAYLEKINFSQINKMQESRADRIDRNIQKIIKIVNSLRSFSRVDMERVGQIDINKCLDDALDIIKPSDKFINFEKIFGDIPAIECKPDEINQCILHVMKNAIDAVSDNGKITVKTELVPDKSMISVSITDNGVGMSEEALSKAFLPFFTTKPVGSGTGVGLSISEHIIKNHNGTISLASKEGAGTTAIIELPVTIS